MLNFTEKVYDHLYDEFRDFNTLSDKISQRYLKSISKWHYLIHTMMAAKSIKWTTLFAIFLQSIKSPIDNEYRFRTLFKVKSNILITPHSNACIERILLRVKKNKREGSEKNRLDIDGTLSSVLAVKLHKPESEGTCYKYRQMKNL